MILFFSAITGFIVVALGAFGAHGLEDQLTDKAMAWWETATLYGLVHAVAALSLTLHGRPLAASAMIIGVALFSGSLYAMALGAPTALGMVTPIGGIGFLAGWAIAAISAFRQ